MIMEETGPEQPTTFGPYQLVSLLGQGGMATVYRAYRNGPMGFRKEVALKRIRADLTRDNQSVVQSLINEARVGGQLKHPNIVDTYEFGVVGQEHYLAMEFVRGLTLRAIIDGLNHRSLRVPHSAVLDLALQIIFGLEYAHDVVSPDGQRLAVVHRDLKPANVILSFAGVAKVMDFGIARSSAALYKTTSDGVAKGTIGYMSPEQLDDPLKVDHRADIFSLGAILFEVATGESLVTGDTIQNMMWRIMSGQYLEQLEQLDEAFPELRPIVGRCIQRSPEDRYQNAGELRAEIDALSANMDLRCGCRILMQLFDSTIPREHTDGIDVRPVTTPESSDSIYPNWADGEPNDERTEWNERKKLKGEDCTILDYKCRGGWHDGECSVTAQFLCERGAD